MKSQEGKILTFIGMNLHVEKGSTPGWLRRTQEMSWEPEILISGIVLLALTQVPGLLDKALYFLEERTLTVGGGASKLVMLLKTATYWLICMLIVHLIFRSVWLSFVGLSYAFPSGIDIRKLKMQAYFENRLMKLPDFELSVIRLERICSTIYAVAFLLVMATISAFIYLSAIIILVVVIVQAFPGINPQTDSIDQLLGYIFIFTGLPYIIDFLTLGLLKRFKWFWFIYRPLYIAMSFITLASVYRGIYYGLVTNLKKRIMIPGLIVFISVTALVTMNADGNMLDRTSMINQRNILFSSFEGYYRDGNAHRMSIWAHIQSDVISDGVLQLFVVHKKLVEESIIEKCPDYQQLAESRIRRDAISSDYDLRIFRRDSLYYHCISNYYKVYIDDKPVNIERWYMREMTASNQQGTFTWIDIHDLSRGHHVLDIYVEDHSPLNRRARIPFFNNSKDHISSRDTVVEGI